MPVYRDKTRQTWYVKFSHKDRSGGRKGVFKSGFSTKGEAQEWEMEQKYRYSGSAAIPIRVFSEVYLEDLARQIRPTTIRRKQSMLRRWILPQLGDRILTEIEAIDILRWQNDLLSYRHPVRGSRLQESYLLAVHKELTALMHHAETFYGLKDNPMDQVRKIGTRSQIKTSFWTKEQYLRFADVIRPDRLRYICFEMLYWCGIRKGELRALTREDFDWSKGRVRINKTLVSIGGKEVAGPPKDSGGHRNVVMPASLAAEVRAWIEENGFAPNERVFPVSVDCLNKALLKGAETAGLPQIRVHDLRHSHVSLLIHLGFSAVAIGKRVGHRSSDITYAYAHMFPTEQTRIAEDLAKLERGECYGGVQGKKGA